MNNGKKPNGFFSTAREAFYSIQDRNRISQTNTSRDRYGEVGSTSLARNRAMREKIQLKTDKILKDMENYTKDKKDLPGYEGLFEGETLEKISKISALRELENDPQNNEYLLNSGRTINASKVLKGKGYSLIATQCPMPNTMTSFIELLCQSKISMVVCLSIQTDFKRMFHYWTWQNCQFNGFPIVQEKSGKHWVSVGLGNNIVYRIELPKQNPNYSEGYLLIGQYNSQSNEIKPIKQIQYILYTSWPDMGIPKDPTTFENLLTKDQILNQRKLLVHCSAGVGRTGVFAGCFEAMKQIIAGKNPNPKEIVEDMRKYRTGMVQQADQFDLLCRFIIRNNPRLTKNGEKLGWAEEFNYNDYFGVKNNSQTYTNPLDKTQNSTQNYIQQAYQPLGTNSLNYGNNQQNQLKDEDILKKYREKNPWPEPNQKITVETISKDKYMSWIKTSNWPKNIQYIVSPDQDEIRLVDIMPFTLWIQQNAPLPSVKVIRLTTTNDMPITGPGANNTQNEQNLGPGEEEYDEGKTIVRPKNQKKKK